MLVFLVFTLKRLKLIIVITIHSSVSGKILNLAQIEGDLKKVLVQETGLEPKEQRLLFQGKEKDDEESLHMVGVKGMSKVVLLDNPASKERKLEEMKRNQSVLKACEEVAKVRAEVVQLSDKVNALEGIVHGGTKVDEKELLGLTELLMVQLLQLDTIEANGVAKVQRRAEVHRVQRLVDTLDNMKARNSNPFRSSGKL
ncbi:BAG family molecular chaperone regulator 4-like isoform X1 [Gossypium australe]|uniref:BAG family molecular chaperone regulator 4-like isoform X1 n=1 Tax=Gossypium australe TaxID=47621 RepID=A0A5B6W8G3_9ROSI|nr:BAG family molecular chaperone regulator 4-like isoform X1 [Gossypium australe]